jgi:hypothetical protein
MRGGELVNVGDEEEEEEYTKLLNYLLRINVAVNCTKDVRNFFYSQRAENNREETRW